MRPNVILGGNFNDNRGNLFYNNNFDASKVKRVYVIENANSQIYRGWQGHKIEQRWFIAIDGSFEIKLIKINNWDCPNKNIEILEFQLNSSSLDVLHVPSGYVSCIRSIENQSKLIAMSDYLIDELEDEYKYPLDYFNNLKR